MAKFVRASKFRHVFGSPYRKEECFDNVPISRSAWDSNFCDVNEKFVACILEAAGGGAFAVLAHKQCGKLAEVPRVVGHKGPVLDIAWNPFNSNMIASGSDDCTVKVWLIPDGGLQADLVEATVTFDKHGRKVGQVVWHPVAQDLLFTSSADLTIRAWNVAKGEEVLSFACHTDSIFWFSFNADGSQLATTCKDKKLRVLDAHTGAVLSEADGHQGAKPSRCAFLYDTGRIVTTGFSKQHERQYILWDAKGLSQLKTEVLDTSSGTLMSFYDPDLKILYLAGKGDGNIRYFEVVEDAPYVHYLSQHTSSDPQRGFGWLPKRALDVAKCEVARLYKLHPKNLIEPISMIVPRKSDTFQDDLFPDTQGDQPSLSAEAFLAGQNAPPKTISLRDGFVPTSVAFVAPVVEPTRKQSAVPTTAKEYEEGYHKLQAEVKKLTDELATKDITIRTLEEQLRRLSAAPAPATE